MITIERRILTKLVRENERYQSIIAKLAVENDHLAQSTHAQPSSFRPESEEFLRLNELLSATTSSYDALQEENAVLRAQNATLQAHFKQVSEQFELLRVQFTSAQSMIAYYEQQQMTSAVPKVCLSDISNQLRAVSQIASETQATAAEFEIAEVRLGDMRSRIDAVAATVQKVVTALADQQKDVSAAKQAEQLSQRRVKQLQAQVDELMHENEEVTFQKDQAMEKRASQDKTIKKLKDALQEMKTMLIEKEDCIETMRQVFQALQSDINKKIGQIEKSGDVQLDADEEMGILRNLQKLLLGAITKK